MSFRVGNVGREDIRAAIALSVVAYREVSNGALQFNLTDAMDILPTPDKPNSARSKSTGHLGKEAVTIYFIAFAAGDGTGAEGEYTLNKIGSTHPYPRATRVVPRRKPGNTEVHLTATTFTERGRARPFAGCLDLIGFRPDRTGLERLGSLGQTPEVLRDIVAQREIADPTITYTLLRSRDFGTEHAAYNDTGLVQVCAFIDIPPDVDEGALRALNPRLPSDLAGRAA